jgi:hypothetical protein
VGEVWGIATMGGASCQGEEGAQLRYCVGTATPAVTPSKGLLRRQQQLFRVVQQEV